MDFAKSERRVLEVLSNSNELTQGEISKLAKMPKRTVRFAVLKLKGRKMLREFLHEDARMSIYAVSGRAGGKAFADAQSNARKAHGNGQDAALDARFAGRSI